MRTAVEQLPGTQRPREMAGRPPASRSEPTAGGGKWRLRACGIPSRTLSPCLPMRELKSAWKRMFCTQLACAFQVSGATQESGEAEEPSSSRSRTRRGSCRPLGLGCGLSCRERRCWDQGPWGRAWGGVLHHGLVSMTPCFWRGRPGL